VAVEDVRVKVREMRTPITMVLLLDVSESMIASLPNVRNAILSMRDIVFKKRGRLGLVIFKGESASTLQVPTTNIDLIVKKLREVGASDLTPLASGMFEAWRLLRNEKAKNKHIIPVLVIISDGIANIPLESPLSQHARPLHVNTAQADVIDVAHLLRREGVRTLVINPSHSPEEETPLSRYKTGIMKRYGKMWYRPTELLLEIPRISGGYYYGIGEEGGLEEVILTQALSIFDRTSR
jgi:magnesium chelatase subunit D